MESSVPKNTITTDARRGIHRSNRATSGASEMVRTPPNAAIRSTCANGAMTSTSSRRETRIPRNASTATRTYAGHQSTSDGSPHRRGEKRARPLRCRSLSGSGAGRGFTACPDAGTVPCGNGTVSGTLDPEIGAVAQLGERMNRTHEVRGSIPLSSTGSRSLAVGACSHQRPTATLEGPTGLTR